jgi:hypothetical protein
MNEVVATAMPRDKGSKIYMPLGAICLSEAHYPQGSHWRESKMHRTFHIAEIVDLIFAELQSPCLHLHYISGLQLNKKLSCRELGALARICKTFRGPASDFFWHDQETCEHAQMSTVASMGRTNCGFPVVSKVHLCEFSLWLDARSANILI